MEKHKKEVHRNLPDSQRRKIVRYMAEWSNSCKSAPCIVRITLLFVPRWSQPSTVFIKIKKEKLGILEKICSRFQILVAWGVSLYRVLEMQGGKKNSIQQNVSQGEESFMSTKQALRSYIKQACLRNNRWLLSCPLRRSFQGGSGMHKNLGCKLRARAELLNSISRPPFSTFLLHRTQHLLYINVKYLNHYFEGSQESSLSGAPT